MSRKEKYTHISHFGKSADVNHSLISNVIWEDDQSNKNHRCIVLSQRKAVVVGGNQGQRSVKNRRTTLQNLHEKFLSENVAIPFFWSTFWRVQNIYQQHSFNCKSRLYLRHGFETTTNSDKYVNQERRLLKDNPSDKVSFDLKYFWSKLTEGKYSGRRWLVDLSDQCRHQESQLLCK